MMVLFRRDEPRAMPTARRPVHASAPASRGAMFCSPRRAAATAMLAMLLAGCAGTAVRDSSWQAPAWHVDVPVPSGSDEETADWWYRSGAARAAGNGAMAGRAKNVIVFLGDGMSLTTVAAARILEGQRGGRHGEENLLSWERFPYTAFSKTYNTDSQTPDSAGTMTAVATGVKTHAGAIGVSAGKAGDCADAQSKQVLSWLRLADSAGLATGIVTTTKVTHATPAATYAHASTRGWESDADMSEAARAAGCHDIAQQLLDFAPGRGPTVVLGGGRRQFMPAGERDPEYPDKVGRRQDGRNLVGEWLQAHPGGAYAWNTAQLRAVKDAAAVLGLFEHEDMQFEHDRDKGDDGEPDLEEMTRFAIEKLSRGKEGFVLLVEGGRIDHGNHDGNAYRALDETISMSRAVRAAAEMTSADDTLIVVTADHAHTLGFVGSSVRGAATLGKVQRHNGDALDSLGLPYTALVYANGAGYTGTSDAQPVGPKTHLHRPRRYSPATGRPDLSGIDTEHPDYLQEVVVPLGGETHGGDDVGIWASGPGSHALRGTLEQNVIYHVIVQATPRLRARLCAAGTCNADGVPVDLPDPSDFRFAR